jgi:hypothetical protein
VFQGAPRSTKAEQASELKPGNRLSVLFLSLAILITGIVPGIALRFVKPLLRWFDLDMQIFAGLQQQALQISSIYLIVIALFALFYVIRKLCVREKTGATWACAYPRVSPKMQSSSITYIQPLAYFLKPFMYKKSTHVMAEHPFPQKVEYLEDHPDAIWTLVVRPVSRIISKFLLFFARIHNGKTNSYIAWALGFLVILLVWVVGFR